MWITLIFLVNLLKVLLKNYNNTKANNGYK